MRVIVRSVTLLIASVAVPTTAAAQAVPTPRSHLGFEVGADRTLANWEQIHGYFGKLATASPAVKLDTLGQTTQGRPMLLVTISSPANMARLEAIRTAQARLADPRRLTAAEESRLAAAQPTVVLISCNIHSTEVASAQMAMELAHRLATNDSLQRSLRDVIVLLLPSVNPDGQDMVVDWYRRYVGTEWEGGPLPWLYHPYVGHDNNRDWFMVTQRETRLVTDLLYRRWFPQIVYDVHQMGNEGARMFVPPMVDPVNPNVDPVIVRGINLIGAEMAWALERHGKQGVADGVIYDLWWHGGMRSTPTRHNMIGLLSEAASVRIATPIEQTPEQLRGHARGLPQYEARVKFPNPWPGGTWRLRDIVDYQLITADALVALASRQREHFVRAYVDLGRRAIRAGETEGPRAYIVPADQHDPSAARRMIEVLRLGAVEVERTTAAVNVGGQSFGTGSFIIRTAQPYRAHVVDLMEPQRFPVMEMYPGGPAERPYDVAGWTLPMQMGVRVARVDSPISAATRPVTTMVPEALNETCVTAANASGAWTLDPRDTRSYTLLARALLAGGTGVASAAPVQRMPVGTFVLDSIPAAALAGGEPFCGRVSRSTPGTRGRALRRLPRVALYRPWTANMDEGWTRWVLENHGIPFTVLTDSTIRAGRLRDQFDVVLVPSMSLQEMREGLRPSAAPPPYSGGLGQQGLEQLVAFATGGGTLVLLDRATELATAMLGAPLRRIIVATPGSTERMSAADATGGREVGALFAPGSILRVLVDNRHPVGAGMQDTAAVYFTNSVTFEVPSGSPARVIARYPERGEDILLSGYLSGANEISGRAAAVEVQVGSGRAILFGFRPQHRAQSVGTFKMLFNALLGGPAD